eukprot:9482712-Pyramimonas_sp.AAC.2
MTSVDSRRLSTGIEVEGLFGRRLRGLHHEEVASLGDALVERWAVCGSWHYYYEEGHLCIPSGFALISARSHARASESRCSLERLLGSGLASLLNE